MKLADGLLRLGLRRAGRARWWVAVLAVSVSGACAEGDWTAWEHSVPGAAGTWTWTAGDKTCHLALEAAAAGVLRISLGPAPRAPATPGSAQVGPGTVHTAGLPLLRFDFQADRVRCRLAATRSGPLFGLGAGDGKVNRAGTRAMSWVDTGDCRLAEQTALPVPMLLSAGGYGLWLSGGAEAEFDLSGEPAVAITVRAPELSLYVWSGDGWGELMRKYCQVAGFPAAPPTWALGPWLGSTAWSSQRQVLEVARRWRALDLPLSAVALRNWHGASAHAFDAVKYPAAGAMIRELHSYGWKLLVGNQPYLATGDPNYEPGRRQSFLTAGPDEPAAGAAAQPPRPGWLDVANPRAVAWWNQLYAPLLELGVDGLLNGLTGEPGTGLTAPHARSAFATPAPAARTHNLYWSQFAHLTAAYLREKTAGEAVLSSARGWAGLQTSALAAAGTSTASWEYLQRDLRGMLAAGWSGLPYLGYDIPGTIVLGDPPSSELYIRWVQLGALSPLLQLCSAARPEPWLLGDSAIQAVRTHGWMRESFLPYLATLALEAEQTGAPMARSLAWEYPADTTAASVEDEFLLGPGVLVAPVCTPGTQRRVYLPAGIWMDLIDGSRYDGPVWCEAQAPLTHLPIYLREGAMVPLKLDGALNVGTPLRERTIRAIEIMPPHQVGTATFDWRRRGAVTHLSCGRRGEDVVFRAWGDRLPAGTVLRFEVGPPDEVVVADKKLPALSEAEVAAGDKRGYCYRKSEQVCFVQPGDDWREITLTEKSGQCCFEEWSAPATLPARARQAAIAVTVPQARPGTVPTLDYVQGDKSGTVRGRCRPSDRWHFTVPVAATKTVQDLTWHVTVTARTGESIQSRERVTVVPGSP